MPGRSRMTIEEEGGEGGTKEREKVLSKSNRNRSATVRKRLDVSAAPVGSFRDLGRGHRVLY